ncbi:MAG TPA: adenylate/guanylate cyclase domain-containing protein [Acidimicrobiia bacterium]
MGCWSGIGHKLAFGALRCCTSTTRVRNGAEIADREELERSIETLEAQRALLGDAIEPAIAALRAQLGAMAAEEHATEDQRKQITVLFADVKGFTDMSRQMDPEDVAAVMNSLWAGVDKVIVDHGGRVDKHIGDAVMALFGAPKAREDDPERAIRAALELQTLINTFGAEQGEAASSLRMRVGINTGLAMLGKVGSTGEYTAIGHAVNLASRLEGLARPGGILISQSTMNQVVGLFNVEASGPLEVKGVDVPVHGFHVKNAKPRTFRVGAREVAGVHTRMVGRDGELQRLESILPPSPSAPAKPVKLATILGDPGVGKSRLVYEYFNYLEGNPHPVWLFRGRAVESSREVPYAVLRSIVLDRFLVADSDAPQVAKEKLQAGLKEYIGDDAERVAPLIGHLIGLDYRDDPAVSGLLSEPKMIRDKAFKAFASLVKNARTDAFKVFLIEDIHWSDEESLDLIGYLEKELAGTPAFILCTARPGVLLIRPDWGDDSLSRITIRLEALGTEATDDLLDDVFQRLEDAPRELRELIAQRSEGNPFFLEELVKMLIDEGVIETKEDRWVVRMDALSRTTIPATLTGVLQARLDSLSRVEREVLQRSSVVGRVFWEEATDHLALAVGQSAPSEMMAEVAPMLKQHELAYQREQSAFGFTREFIFKHAILHDVAYESVVRKTRKIYHHEVARWLIQAAGDREVEFAGQVADHYDRAGDTEDAVRWLVNAGDRARQTHAPEVAARAYRRAIELTDDAGAGALHEARISALGGLGDVLTMRAEYEAAIEVYEKLCVNASGTGDLLAVARAQHGISTAETHRGRSKRALASAILSREAAVGCGDRSQEAKAVFLEAWSNIRLGDFSEGVRLAAELLEISREVEEPTQLAEALNLEGVIAASLGSYDEAAGYFTEAASLYESAGNQEKLMPILNNLGVIAELRGDYVAAEHSYSDALSRARDISDRDAELVYSSNLGGALVALRRSDEAETILRAVIDLAPGEFSLISETYRFLAEALMGRGVAAEAEEMAVAALNLALASGAPDHTSAAWRVLGSLASMRDAPIDLDVADATGTFTASELFEKSLQVASDVESEADRAKALVSWAMHDLKIGDRDSCQARWDEARAILAGLGAELEIDRVERILDSADTASQ